LNFFEDVGALFREKGRGRKRKRGKEERGKRKGEEGERERSWEVRTEFMYSNRKRIAQNDTRRGR